jgi:hypothetical protein
MKRSNYPFQESLIDFVERSVLVGLPANHCRLPWSVAGGMIPVVGRMAAYGIFQTWVIHGSVASISRQHEQQEPCATLGLWHGH